MGEIEVIQIIGKELITHNDDHDSEEMVKKQRGKTKGVQRASMMSSPGLGSSDAVEALVIEVSDISQC